MICGVKKIWVYLVLSCFHHIYQQIIKQRKYLMYRDPLDLGNRIFNRPSVAKAALLM